MKNQLIKTILCCSLVLLFIGTSMAAKINQNIKNDIQISTLNIDKNAKTIKNSINNGNQQQDSTIAIASKTKRLVDSGAQEIQSTIPDILNKQKTFEITLYYEKFKDNFVLSLNDFIYDSANRIYSYTLPAHHIFETKSIPFGSLNQLSIQFKLQIPYKIYYTYEIQTYPLESAPFGDFMFCRVTCSPMIVENRVYKATETFNAESIYESYDDFDGTVIKRALDYVEGDGHKSTAYFKVNSQEYADKDNVYQRGMLYLSAIIGDGKTPSGGAMASASIQTLGFNILGTMNTFWIDSGWQGTIGDKYSTSCRFQIEPR